MTRIVINACYGGFSLSPAAAKLFKQPTHQIPRDDPQLIQVVEEMGEAAGGKCAELRVVEIPDNVLWLIEEYDGLEHVAEKHRTWY